MGMTIAPANVRFEGKSGRLKAFCQGVDARAALRAMLISQVRFEGLIASFCSRRIISGFGGEMEVT
jgi:hypothetical protein